MAADERSRKVLCDNLEATLGRKPADTAMALPSPVGWADVATRQDVATAKQEVINTMTWRMLGMLLVVIGAFAGVMAAFIVPLYS
jgi:hypothetical protein